MTRTLLAVESLPDRVVPASVALTAVGAAAGADPTLTVLTADGATRFVARPFGPEFRGGVRVALGDVTGDGTPDAIAAAGPGGEPTVKVLDGVDGRELASLSAFERSFRGGLFVAAGDVTGDGLADLVLTPDRGGGPRVRVVSGRDFGTVADFFGIADPDFRGGARPAVGDLDRDGVADVVVAAGFGGGPRVAAFDGRALTTGVPARLFGDRFVFEPGLRDGAFVAAGDVTGDGFADLVAGSGPGGGPRIRAFGGRELVQSGADVVVADFFAGDPADRGGVRVAVGTPGADWAGRLLTSGPGQAVGLFDLGGRPTAGPGAGSAGEFVASAESAPVPVPEPAPPVPPQPEPPPAPPEPPVPPQPEPPPAPPEPPVPPPPVPPPPVPPVPPPAPSPPAPQPPPAPTPPSVFEDEEWAYYVPSGVAAGRDYPVVFAFSPAGDARQYDAVLRPLAEQYKWVVAGNKSYRNGDPDLGMSLNANGSIGELGPGYPRLRDAITAGLGKVPADDSRVILFGFSGGGSVAHALSLAYPGLADALIIDTAMIWGDAVIGPNPGEGGPVNGPFWNRYLDANADDLRRAFAANGSRRLAAFLESPTDFRYEEMQADAERLRGVGWRVSRIAFAGGHALAPLSAFEQAAAWIARDPAWQ